ncbi:MAG: glycosyltransferase family 2 protein [Candidatus Aminicenantes bacterium]|nr:glycosyltransferase family 2 protein [Candidatus Aminicenantes bacterium]
MNKETIISVIICTYNRQEELKRFLETLNKQSQLPDELIIVDASQNYDTRHMLEQKSNQLPFDVIYKRTPPGLTRQRNTGFSLSRGNFLFFFDDDVELEKKFIEVIAETFEKFKKFNVGGIMGRVINISLPRKSWDLLFRRLFFLSDFGQGLVKLSGLPSIKIDNELSFVESLSGGCMVYLKEVFDQFKFDENLKRYAYLEDVDFSYRVGKKYRLLYQPKARLKHFPSTYLKANSRELRKMFIQHQAYLFHKNMPKDFLHYFGYYLSIIGVFLYNGLILRDFRACKGIIEGLLEPLVG